MTDQPVQEKLMIEITVGQVDDGPMTVVAHGRLEDRAEQILRTAAPAFAALLRAGWTGRAWIDPEEGHIRLNVR
jgi:hypothetical protein